MCGVYATNILLCVIISYIVKPDSAHAFLSTCRLYFTFFTVVINCMSLLLVRSVSPAYQLFCTFNRTNRTWSLLLLKRYFLFRLALHTGKFASHKTQCAATTRPIFGKCNHFVVRSSGVLCWWRHRTLIIKILNFNGAKTRISKCSFSHFCVNDFSRVQKH